MPPQHTSTTCPLCKHRAAANRTTQSKFKCIDCVYENHADLVGAKNILKQGEISKGQDYARLACQVNDNSHQQREPSEIAAVKA